MFLGIDIGTSGVKSTIVDVTGKVCAHACRPLISGKAVKGKRELDPFEIEIKAVETIQEVLAASGHQRVELISISSLGEAVIPVAVNGRPLMGSIVGSDPRGSEELEELRERLGEQTLTNITGLNLSCIYSLNKILYIRKYFPEVHRSVWKYMCFTDYIGFLLTGETQIDYSMASRTMAFDYRKKEWSASILDAAGISASVFSKPVQGGSIIGNVTGRMKEKLGFGYDIPVMVGSHDHIFNAIGAGAVLPGVCSNTVGTTEGITALLSEPMKSDNIIKNNISCEPFVKADIYNTVAWHNTAGAMVNWYLDTFYQETKKNRQEILAQLNQMSGREPSSLMVLPHFSGATAIHMDEKAKGCIVGLTMSSTREEIYQAVLEGASYEFRVICDSICEAGIDMRQIIVSGGGSNSEPWLHIKADILGRPVYRAVCADTGAVGGAVLGAYILGRYASLEDAARAMVRPAGLVEPNMYNHKIYEERFEKYKELYGHVKEINHILNK